MAILAEAKTSARCHLFLSLQFHAPRHHSIQIIQTTTIKGYAKNHLVSNISTLSSMSEILNANPTIRNASDLPSRRRDGVAQTSKTPLGLFSSTVPPSAYLPDPFSPSQVSDSDGSDDDLDTVEPIDEQEIYGMLRCLQVNRSMKADYFLLVDLISDISDPEHPLTLGSLSVVNLPDISIKPLSPTSPLTVLTVLVTPTITHCSLATVIGLGVRVRLEQALPPRFRVDVRIKEGTHSTAEQVNRQLGDKERVAAALENGTLMGVLRKMLEGCNNGAV